ncbi:hypothetical protein SASPL_133276 [Salvia splendens]|uniref:Uncharacterized protein n=1 Tax=Salvia splendens TaxID=180675 RepID=A0A8X8X3Z9_SALSN|nr:hypothetical protein SASPL_133276 [Salvia splendens]
MPEKRIKATPHVSSKLQQWKKNHYSLVNMLKRSNVGFNYEGDHKIEELYHDMRSNLNVDNGSQESEFEASVDGHSGHYGTNPDNTSGSPEIPNQSKGDSDTGNQLPVKTNGDIRTQLPKKTGTKCKFVDKADALLEFLAKGHNETNTRFDKLARRIEFDV